MKKEKKNTSCILISLIAYDISSHLNESLLKCLEYFIESFIKMIKYK